VTQIARKHNTSIVANVAQTARPPGELASRLLAKAPQVILALLIVLFAFRAALLVSYLAGASTPPPVVAQPVAPAVARQTVDIPSILRANLFGQPPTPAGLDAPVSTMGLNLTIVFAGKDEKLGWATLGTGPTDLRVYKVGDALPGGATLHAVYEDRVLVDRGGAIEAVLLPKRLGLGAPPPPLPTVANPAASVARVQQLVQNNPGLINQVIQRQAVFENGRLRGMRVNPGPNAQAFAKLGLRPQDVITAVNGTVLDDQTRSNEIFNTLSNSAVARVTVLRSGREQELTLNLAEIANEAERLAEAPPPVTVPDGPPTGPESER
jgi:general secretion pathway protein C